MEKGHKQEENLLTVFDPCGRVQPETDLFEFWRLEGSRLTLRVDEGKEKGQFGRQKEEGEQEDQERNKIAARKKSKETNKQNRNTDHPTIAKTKK